MRTDLFLKKSLSEKYREEEEEEEEEAFPLASQSFAAVSRTTFIHRAWSVDPRSAGSKGVTETGKEEKKWFVPKAS